MTKISDTTSVTLTVVISALTVTVGAVLWMTSVDTKASYARDQISEVKMEQKEARQEMRAEFKALREELSVVKAGVLILKKRGQ